MASPRPTAIVRFNDWARRAGLLEYTGAHPLNPTMRGVGCRIVLHSGQRRIEVSGPHLIEEASVIHRDYWSP